MVEEKVLRRIKPSADEEKAMREVCRELVGDARAWLSKNSLAAEVSVHGSVSRGTWLSYEKDIDLFLSFPQRHTKKELERYVTLLGRSLLKGMEKRFAEHPYVRGEYKGYNVEIVPCYAVVKASEKLSAVDRSPFHDSYVKKRISGREDDVRLLKQFLRGIGCYGAEARVEGFSGYLCELLVLYYGSFKQVLKSASRWKPPLRLSFAGEEPGDAIAPAPLILLDPTDSDRNVASALSEQNLSLFIYAAKRYLSSPSERFFFPVERVVSVEDLLEKLGRRGSSLLSISFPAPDVIEDILYPQLRKTVRLVEGVLKAGGFPVLGSSLRVGEHATLGFELQLAELPGVMLHTGPPVNSAHEANFLKKHLRSTRALSKPFIRGGRWMVYLERREKRASELLKRLFTAPDPHSRGIPKHVARAAQRGVEIKRDEEALKAHPALFAELIDPVFPWEVG